MKLVSLLVLSIGMGLMACSSPNSPDIEATMEVRVAQEREIEATPAATREDIQKIDQEGRALMDKGDLKAAIKKFDEVIELDPGDVYITRAYHNRGLS